MAWPSSLSDIDCVGFSKSILPVLKEAIDKNRIKWTSGLVYDEFSEGFFNFVDCEWRLVEIREMVVSIILVSGILDSEHLTYEVLRH